MLLLLCCRLHASSIQHMVAVPSRGVLVTADAEGQVLVHRMTELLGGMPLMPQGELPQGEVDQMWVQVRR